MKWDGENDERPKADGYQSSYHSRPGSELLLPTEVTCVPTQGGDAPSPKFGWQKFVSCRFNNLYFWKTQWYGVYEEKKPSEPDLSQWTGIRKAFPERYAPCSNWWGGWLSWTELESMVNNHIINGTLENAVSADEVWHKNGDLPLPLEDYPILVGCRTSCYSFGHRILEYVSPSMYQLVYHDLPVDRQTRIFWMDNCPLQDMDGALEGFVTDVEPRYMFQQHGPEWCPSGQLCVASSAIVGVGGQGWYFTPAMMEGRQGLLMATVRKQLAMKNDGKGPCPGCLPPAQMNEDGQPRILFITRSAKINQEVTNEKARWIDNDAEVQAALEEIGEVKVRDFVDLTVAEQVEVYNWASVVVTIEGNAIEHSHVGPAGQVLAVAAYEGLRKGSVPLCNSKHQREGETVWFDVWSKWTHVMLFCSRHSSGDDLPYHWEVDEVIDTVTKGLAAQKSDPHGGSFLKNYPPNA